MLVRCFAGLVLAAAAQGGLAQAYSFPMFRNAEQVRSECQRMLADLGRQARALEAQPAGKAGALQALDAMQRRAEDTLGPLGLLAAVHPVKPIRDAADACDLSYQGFTAAFQQNPRAYARLKAAQGGDAIDRRLQRDQLDVFEDSGVALAGAAQRRARAINRELTKLAQDFERRVREDHTTVAYTEAELQGVPSAAWRDAKRDAQGRYLLGLDYPSSDPVMQKADLATTRERMWRAFNVRGGVANLQTLARLADLRREYAKLFGFDSYADFALRRRMAKSEAEVQRFLAEVQGEVGKRERSDIELLRDAKAAQLSTPAESTTVQRWDVEYYIERVRAATYAVDQEALREYFPPEPSLRFVFALAERLFGVHFDPVEQTLWHPDARAFFVTDAADGRPIGTLFVDLYPRADKYGHAAVWPVINASAQPGRLPVAGLVVNFNRQGLTLEELETLLHEFGHALHGLLSTTRYALHGGTSVQLDFVEAPSQMLEDWVYDPAVLKVFQQVCPECKVMPTDTIERAARARHFAKGLTTARQLFYAGYDLALYGRTRQDPMALWTQMEGATPLGTVPGTMHPASFSHVASGYSAGYYSYMWSLALAEDLRTPFAANKLDPAAGRRYRDSVLANGGQVAPEELMQRFLGRPSNRDAFFRWLRQQ
jgi:thimet oligopeptidase